MNAHAARPKPFTSSAGSRCPRSAASTRTIASANAMSPGRFPSCARPISSTRRTAAASSPTPAENAKRLPLTRPTVMRRVRLLLERLRNLARSRDRIGRQAERARQHARAAAGQERDRRVALEPVQGLVEAAVAGEDDDRLRRRRGMRLRRAPIACRGRSVFTTVRRATRESSRSTVFELLAR